MPSKSELLRSVLLVKSNLNHVISLLKIGEYSLKKIKQNLAMSYPNDALSGMIIEKSS